MSGWTRGRVTYGWVSIHRGGWAVARPESMQGTGTVVEEPIPISASSSQ